MLYTVHHDGALLPAQTMDIGEQVNNTYIAMKAITRRFHKRQHRRAMRRIPIGEYVPYNRYKGWAD